MRCDKRRINQLKSREAIQVNRRGLYTEAVTDANPKRKSRPEVKDRT